MTPSELNLEDGDEVTAFPDKSGNGPEIESLEWGTPPNYYSGIINGLPGIGGAGGEPYLCGEGSIDYELRRILLFYGLPCPGWRNG